MTLPPRLYRPALAPLALIILFLSVGCSGPVEIAPPSRAINAGDFQAVIDILCDDVMEGRDAGTKGIDIARDYLITKFTRIGLEPAFVVDGKLSYTQPLTIPIGGNAEGEPVEATISNVGALLPGVGGLADEVIIVGAHYDHIGYGHVGSRDPGAHGHIHPGADDNASGTAGVVLLANHFVQAAERHPDRPRRTILFTCFAGEERGLFGSRYMTQYQEQWTFDADKAVAMINMDMIGRMREDVVHIFGHESGEQWRSWVEAANQAVGLDADMDIRAPGGSDHIPFIRAGIPAIFFNTRLHDDYHTPRDTPDKINAQGGARVLHLVANVMEHAATTPEQLVYVAPPPRQPRPFIGVMLGESDADGVLISETVADGPADKAGVLPGDLIVTFAGEPVTDFGDLRRLIRASKPGDEVAVTLVREGEEVELTIELGAR